MDYSKYRQSSSDGQAVSVNHRALITRALTKYPVDHALFRELLQNSADARASSATIQFHSPSTDKQPSSIHTIPINRLLFSNDGEDFCADDWKRLKEIASGNPNESKIGAFGVGFYSVFELTDEPLVHSGNRIVNFKYKGIQLQYYDMDTPNYRKGTLIDLPYKHEGTLGNVGDFIGFLIQSFLLINLKEIKVEVLYGDNSVITLLHLEKFDGASKPMSLPPTFRHLSSPFFKLSSVQKTDVSVKAKYMNAAYIPPLNFNKGVFSFGKQLFSTLVDTPKDKNGYTEFNCNLLRVDASITVNASQKFKDKITESLLKPPPKKTSISLLSIGDSDGKSTDVAHLNRQLRPYVFPEDINDAKVFIGFSTKQSTGFRLHLALQSAIPTMERTAMDLSHNYVKDWNYELLKIAGMVARIAYEDELYRCRQDIGGNSQSLASNLEKAKFICSRYKFEQSAPDKTIGMHVKAGFYGCATESLVPSNKGVLPNTVVKYTDKKLVTLIRNIPIVDDMELATQLSKFVKIYKATPSEIAQDIQSSPLRLDQAREYVSWLSENREMLDESEMVSLTSALKISFTSTTTGDNNKPIDKVIDIGSSTRYLDRSILHSAIVANNLPDKCIPAEIAQEIGHTNLQRIFGIWPLSADEWIEIRTSDLRTIQANSNASKTLMDELVNEILQVASESWPYMDTAMKKKVFKCLGSVRCIPTNMGLQYPKDCYIEPIKGFSNFPVAINRFPSKWLEEIGVRKSISMEIVLKKLSSNELDWSNTDLINYLTQHRRDLKQSDINVLINGNLFRSNNYTGLFKASSLYAPDETLSILGFPTLDFEGWNDNSPSAALMRSLRLMSFPSEIELFKRAMASKQVDKAISFFLKHASEAKYSIRRVEGLKFIPTTQYDTFATPSECYWDSNVDVFNKPVIAKRYEHVAKKLGVRKAPSTSSLFREVVSHPKHFLSSPDKRERIFSYFSQNLSDLSGNDVSYCKEVEFLPLQNPKSGTITWFKPRELYLPSQDFEDSSTKKIRHLLPTYNPTAQSIPFLSFIGVRDKPTPKQLVELIISDPVKTYQKLDDKEMYEQILCIIGKNWQLISKDTNLVEHMKRVPFLVGEKRRDKESSVQVSLYRASDLVVVDDAIIFNQFKNWIITAPQDKNIEILYTLLGTPKLSTLLRERFICGDEFENDKVRNELQERIQERLKLFIENTTSRLKSKNSRVNIKLVRSIKVERQLPPHPVILTNLTCCYDARNDVLLIDPVKIDWLDVANALSKKIMEKPDQDSVVVLELQLSASLSSLERKGYNIERLRRPLKSDYSLEDFLKTSSTQPPQAKPPQAKSPIEDPSRNLQNNVHSKGVVPPYTEPKKSIDTQPKLNPVNPSAPLPPAVSTQRNPQQGVQQSAPFTGGNNQANSGILNWASKMFGGSTFSSGDRSHQTRERSQGEQIRGLDDVLRRGASDVRPFNGNTLRSEGNQNEGQGVSVDVPNNFNCGSELEHNLHYCQTLSNNVKVYQDDKNTQPRQDELLLSERLLRLAGIFNVSPDSIHVFREKSTTIAFNRGGSLFFNSYHLADTQNENDFWYTVMAHELAHNMSTAHNAIHSFYTEGYIRRTLRKYISSP